MTQKETTNTIIKLKELGLSGDEIIKFLAFVETHNPSEEEAMQAIDGQRKADK